MTDQIIKLRAHHGMCIAYFQGQGYSEIFTEHMKSIIKLLKENPTIQLITRADIICEKCPNLIPKRMKCNTAVFVQECDKKVLTFCGLEENQILTWDEFFKIVCERILFPEKRAWNGRNLFISTLSCFTEIIRSNLYEPNDSLSLN